MALERFITAQENTYHRALREIRNGKKSTHWMWYIFPQIKGLGHSPMSELYAIKDLQEANDYLLHPTLGQRLIEISGELLNVTGKSIEDIFGFPDTYKLCSSMTLFAAANDTDPVFNLVLKKYFNGVQDAKTLEILHK
jgi:uncharacterized protein (DUF1810 family)